MNDGAFFGINRNGITRTVILVGSYAFKLPCMRYRGQRWRCLLRGLLANMQEVAVWRTRWSELCPIVAHIPGGWLVIMRRVRPLTDAEWATFDEEKFINVARSNGSRVPVEDGKHDSYGVLNGRIVAVDYGGFAAP